MTTLDFLSFLVALGPVLEIEKFVGARRARQVEVRLVLLARAGWRSGLRLVPIITKLLAIVLLWALFILIALSDENLAILFPSLNTLKPLFDLYTFSLIATVFSVWQILVVLKSLKAEQANELRNLIVHLLPVAIVFPHSGVSYVLGPAFAYAQFQALSVAISKFVTTIKQEPSTARFFPSTLLQTPSVPNAAYGMLAFFVLPILSFVYGTIGATLLVAALPICRLFLAIERLRGWAGGQLAFNMVVYLLTIVGAICLVLSKLNVA